MLSLTGVEAEAVRLDTLHAALSRWFDHSEPEHAAALKPYSLSVPRRVHGTTAVEVGVLTDAAERSLISHARPGQAVRLGRHLGRLTGFAIPLQRASWPDLAARTGHRAWVLRFATPASFRRGRRSSPWPAPGAVLRGLSQRWEHASGLGSRALTPQQADTVWVSDIDGASDVIRIGGTVYSGFAGRVRYQCDDPEVAALVGPLFELAPYAGVGSATAKGLGTTLMEPTWQPHPASNRALEAAKAGR